MLNALRNENNQGQKEKSYNFMSKNIVTTPESHVGKKN